MTVRVGVVGAGGVGSALGGQLLKAGGRFTVKYGSRDPASAKIKELLAAQPQATAASIHETVDASDVIILSTPNPGDDASIQATAAMLGPGIKGKIVVDATNPLAGYPALAVRWGEPLSGGEVLAAALPDSFVFKAFNTIGVNQMPVPDGSDITGEQLTMLFAGPAEHEAAVADVISGVGFVPKYVGPIRYARNLEAIAELWIHLTVPSFGDTPVAWGRSFHFQTITKP